MHQKDAKTFDKENWYVHAYYEKKEKMFGHTEKVAVTIYEKEILDIITTLLNAFEIETMFFTYPIRTSGYPVGLYLSFSRKIEEGQARQLNQKGGN